MSGTEAARKINTADVAARLVALRESLGVDVHTLAERSGLPVFTVERAERGTMSLATLAKLRPAYGDEVSLDFILWGNQS